jgi:hypothetical protein
MEIGSKISTSFTPGYGTTGLFLEGTLFGQKRVALLTNSHVIGAERNLQAKATWEALSKVWVTLTQQMAPGPRKKALLQKLWELQAAGNLFANPPKSVLRDGAGAATVFGAEPLSMLDLYGTVSVEGVGIVADALYQTEISNDYALAILRTGITYDNLAPSEQGKHAIAGVADPATGKVVVKAGATTHVTRGVITKAEVSFFIVQGDPNDFSDKGDSGSAIFDEAHNWVGLIYADALGTTDRRMKDGTKCIPHSTVMVGLKKLFGDDLKLAPANGVAP